MLLWNYFLFFNTNINIPEKLHTQNLGEYFVGKLLGKCQINHIVSHFYFLI